MRANGRMGVVSTSEIEPIERLCLRRPGSSFLTLRMNIMGLVELLDSLI